jgi:tol-pal system protein YbgF
MRRQRHRSIAARARRLATLALIASVVVGGCASGDRAEREREIAALRSQIEEVRKAQQADARELARLAGEMKALDAQSTFVISEVKATSEERARVKAAIEETGKTVRDLQGTVESLSKAAVTPAAQAAPSAAARGASPEQIYGEAMKSVQAEDYARAATEFSQLTGTYPDHPLASNAQYWIGEAYYRQREFTRAVAEFRKVIDAYPKSAQVPEALLKIGMCHRALQDRAQAREAWEQVAKDYPESNAASQARSLLATLKGDAAPGH